MGGVSRSNLVQLPGKPRSTPSKSLGQFAKFRSDDEAVQLFLSPKGEVTKAYPRVHVIYDDGNGRVIVAASVSRTKHVFRKILPATATGNDIDAVIRDAMDVLRSPD